MYQKSLKTEKQKTRRQFSEFVDSCDRKKCTAVYPACTMRHLKLTTLGRYIAIAGLMTLSTLAEPGAADSPTGILRQGLPGRRISGGSRSPDAACLTTPNQPVVALMPKTNLGLTLQEHPTFWFAIPGIAANKSLEFGLFDTDGNLLHQQNIAVPSDAGITSIALPETAQTLDLEQMVFICRLRSQQPR